MSNEEKLDSEDSEDDLRSEMANASVNNENQGKSS